MDLAREAVHDKEEWEVEKILNRRKVRGKDKFLV